MPEIDSHPLPRLPVQELLLQLLNFDQGGRAVDLAGISFARWEELIHLAVRYGVQGLLHRSLERIAPAGRVPVEIVADLRGHVRDTALKNLRLFQRLHQALAALNDEVVPVIVLKGAHLAQTIYGDLALRSMGDLDLLIRKEDLGRAENCLRELGYCLSTGFVDRRWFSDNHFHFPYDLPGEDVVIELHWDLVSPGFPIRPDLEGLWERSEKARIAGVPARVLAPEDLLLYLCMHLSLQFLYAYYPIRSLYDIASVVNAFNERLDWEELGVRAKGWGAVHSTCLTLALAEKELGVKLTPQLLSSLAPDGYEASLLDWAQERLFLEREKDVAPWMKPPMSDQFERFWTTGNLRERVRTFWQVFFPPIREMSTRYGLPLESKRVFLFYPLRWLELLQLHARRAVLLLLRNPQATRWAERERRRMALASWLVAG